MRIDTVEQFLTGERVVVTSDAFKVTSGIAARQLRNGFPLGYVQPGDAVFVDPSIPQILVPLTTVSVEPLENLTPEQYHALERVVFQRLITLEWPLRQRVAKELLLLLEFLRLVKRSREGPVIPVTQGLLAELIGVTREATAIVLKELSIAGCIKLAYGRIVVINVPLLTQEAARE